MAEKAQNSAAQQSKASLPPLIRTLSPLAIIPEGFLEQIHSAGKPETSPLLIPIHTALERVLDQTQQLLNILTHFRTLESTKAVRLYQEPSIHDSVQQVLRGMQYEFPLERVTILKILPHDLTALPIPQEDFEAVLFQLLYNCREAVGETSAIITIEASRIEALSSENQNQERFQLRVSDTGPGIPQEALRNLYDPFYALGQTGRFHAFGFFLIKKILDYYKGFMRIETSLMGSSCTLEFLN